MNSALSGRIEISILYTRSLFPPLVSHLLFSLKEIALGSVCLPKKPNKFHFRLPKQEKARKPNTFGFDLKERNSENVNGSLKLPEDK